MGDLRELLTARGYAGVRTHLQSGNVVFESRARPAQLERALREAISGRFGFDVEVMVRTREELKEVVDLNPLGDVARDASRYLVWFLAAKPAAAVARELAAVDAAPEALAVAGRELYTWHPGGSYGSPLRKVLTDTRLGVSATNRNWNTVTRLRELADE